MSVDVRVDKVYVANDIFTDGIKNQNWLKFISQQQNDRQRRNI